VIVLLAAVLALSSADAATVGAAAMPLRSALGIGNTDIGLLVTVTSLVAALASLPFGVLADRVRRTRMLGIAIVLWGGAMIWSSTVSTFDQLLVTRLVLGGVTAAAGPIVASLVGDYFASAERGRVYGYILAGEVVGAGFGFAVTGDIATLSWRAAFVVLALPAFVLAWLIFRLPEPARGGREPLVAVNAKPSVPEPEGDAADATDAQRLARERGLEPDPVLVQLGDPRRMGLVAATRYILRIRTNVILILASAGGYFFLAGVQTFGVEFVTRQYGIDQALGTLVLLVVGAGGVVGVLAGGTLGDLLLRHGRLKWPDPRQRHRGDRCDRSLHSRDLHPGRRVGPAVHHLRRPGALRSESASGRGAARHHGSLCSGAAPRACGRSFGRWRRPSHRSSSVASPSTCSAADAPLCNGRSC
jgi:MFS family permease